MKITGENIPGRRPFDIARSAPLDIARPGPLNIAGPVSLSVVDGSTTGRETFHQKAIRRVGTSCLPSTEGVIAVSTSRFELLQPLDRCVVSIRHGCGGGHEEQAGQQSENEDEPLGVHREYRRGSREMKVRRKGSWRGRLSE